MTELPLPPSLARCMRSAGDETNRSLLFDRGFDRYTIADGSVDIPKEEGRDGKTVFHARFVDDFQQPADFRAFVERRTKALERAKTSTREVQTLTLQTRSRLVCGMGLPHPTGNGLLLDRLTGCPYLPGSTIKGLLRAAAALVAEGELEIEDPEGAGDAAFWEEHLHRIFGPDRTASEPARGQVVFYDAFPREWPKLEVDVLTPHYQPYYANGESPGDWHDPIPVTFLTVRPGTPFEFAFQAAPLPHAPGGDEHDPLPRLARLLPVALDWLGVGGKKSSGYGVFGEANQSAVARRQPNARKPGDSVPEPVTPTVQAAGPKQSVWKGVELEIAGGNVTVWRNKKQSATCAKQDLPRELLKKLKKGALRVDAVVVQQGPSRWRIESVEEAL